MAYITADRVKETTNSTGTGAITLAGASKACQAFSAVMSIGDTCSYAIVSVSGSEWETGVATYSAANTLTRTTVKASSNGGALVDFPAGSKDVFLGPTASAVLDRNASVYELGSAKSDDAYVVITPPLPESHTREGASLYLLAGLSNSDGYTPVKAGDLILSGGTQYGGIRTQDNEGRVIIQGSGGNLLEWRDGESVRGYIDYNGSFSLNPYDTSAGSTNEIRFVELASNGTNYVGFKAPDSIASNRIWTLPSGDGSANQGLVTNGSGVLSWATNTGTGSNVLSNAPTLTTATFAAGTISTSTPNTITQTWNNAAVTFSGLTMNVTDSASTAASYLVDLQVGGVSQVQIEKTGIINFWHNGGAKKLLGLTSATGSAATGIYAYGSSGTAWGFFAAGAFGFGLSGNGGTITTSGFLGWGSSPNDGNPDLRFYRDAADTLAQRRTTNAQTFRVYNTYTDASNYERFSIGWSSNLCTLGYEKAGTGAQRYVSYDLGANPTAGSNKIVSVSTNSYQFWSANTVWMYVTNGLFGYAPYYYAGAIRGIQYGQNNAGAANRIGDSYVFRVTGGSGTADPGYIGFGAAYVPVGATSLTGHTQQDALLIKLLALATPIVAFGDSFVSTVPAIKRVGTQLRVRLADDSADASFSAQYIQTPALTVATLPSASTAGMGSRAFVSDANATTFASVVAGGGSNKVPVYSDGTNWLIG